MPLPYPTTDDTPSQVALHPDWGAGVRQGIAYRTDISRSRRGLEQRSQRRRRPMLTMEYQVSQNDVPALLAIETTASMSRTPLLVPWWPDGNVIEGGMVVDNFFTLAHQPIEDDWQQSGWLYLWHRDHGGEFRELNSLSGRNVSMTGTGILFPAGSYAWPVRLCVRDRDDNLLESPGHRAQTDRAIFRTL